MPQKDEKPEWTSGDMPGSDNVIPRHKVQPSVPNEQDAESHLRLPRPLLPLWPAICRQHHNPRTLSTTDGSPNQRGTRAILYSALVTIWLCTWASLCLNIPPRSQRRWHTSLLYKFRWQLFAVFFPEVLVATASEQWLSARQSVREFARLGHPSWTMRHAFYADMGGTLVAPPDTRPFPVDAQQVAYLVERGHLEFPDITLEEIRALNKADGLARVITLAQMGWFCLACAARGASGLGFCTLEATTLAYILCTMHTFFFWYHKPLDPGTQRVLPMRVAVADIARADGRVPREYFRPYPVAPLEFVKPLPDVKSLVAPFWFGLSVVVPTRKYPDPVAAAVAPTTSTRTLDQDQARPKDAAQTGAVDATPMIETLPNTRILPQDGVTALLTAYNLLFQVAYFGLHIGFAFIAPFPSPTEFWTWTLSNGAAFSLIAVYVAAIPVGTYLSPYLGPCLFGRGGEGGVTGQETIFELASRLPRWAKVAVHAPFVLGYLAARMVVLVESGIGLRTLPGSMFSDVEWTRFLPHV